MAPQLALQRAAELALLVDSRHELGEGVQWCERSARVFWTDIEGARLHAFHPASGALASWPMPERLACFAFTEDPACLLVGLASRLAWFNLDSGLTVPIMAVEADLPSTRLNDGRCDRHGRFVFGTMDEGKPRRALGSFYRLHPDLSLERLPLPRVAIANSICFSPDDAMYFCDSLEKIIYRWDGYGGGDPAAIGVFADARTAPGSPDGAAIDAAGQLWSAQWGAGQVLRYAGDGRVDLRLPLAASQPSCVCFGGAGLDELFVTSAWQTMDAGMREKEPAAGALYHGLNFEVLGLPEARFGGLPLSTGWERHAQA